MDKLYILSHSFALAIKPLMTINYKEAPGTSTNTQVQDNHCRILGFQAFFYNSMIQKITQTSHLHDRANK